MHRRFFSSAFSAVFIFWFSALVPAWSQDTDDKEQASRGRSVIVFLFDDLGFGELSAYRNLYRYVPSATDEPSDVAPTPHLDKLASQGVICTRAYSHCWCAPTRQSLLSGMWNNRNSAYGRPWIGNHMRNLGMRTLMVGKNHGDLPAKRILDWRGGKSEFDETFHVNLGEFAYYRNPQSRYARETGDVIRSRTGGQKPVPYLPKGEEYITDLFAERMVSFIDQQASAQRGFFIYCAFNAPHSPLHGKPEDMRALFPTRFGSWSDERIREDGLNWRNSRYQREHIMAMVHAADRAIGTVVAALRRHGVYDDTLIIVTSDNGGARDGKVIRSLNYPLSGAKHDSLDGGIRVPFIVSSGELAASRDRKPRYDGLVSVCDILPTAVRFVDPSFDPAAVETDGANLMPHLLGLKPTLTGRRYFMQAKIAKDRSVSFHEPTDGYNAVLIKDDYKLQRICDDGAKPADFRYVLQHLPDVAGDRAPATRLRESYDKDNVDDPEIKSAMIREMESLLAAEGDDLSPEWSGNPANAQVILPILHRYLKSGNLPSRDGSKTEDSR
ncbi:MAG: sulfatase-like hydrolase/transferase [Akkermansiaceae bacterium]|jgi:arylsulfatase A-like enzyme|nr:sulfatase-like hydrolase/transferase [Akkermansiaceae bacterium]